MPSVPTLDELLARLEQFDPRSELAASMHAARAAAFQRVLHCDLPFFPASYSGTVSDLPSTSVGSVE